MGKPPILIVIRREYNTSKQNIWRDAGMNDNHLTHEEVDGVVLMLSIGWVMFLHGCKDLGTQFELISNSFKIISIYATISKSFITFSVVLATLILT